MQLFTPLQYMKIDIANLYGEDKEVWEDRLTWFQEHEHELLDLVEDADDPFMYYKAVKAYHEVLKGNPTGHTIHLDATCQGYQIMAVLSGCPTTAANVNLINTGKREDLYGKVANSMNSILPIEQEVNRSNIKHPVMTTAYNSKAAPKNLFGDGTPELEAFYATLYKEVSGAMEVMEVINRHWDNTLLHHTWTLPDGFVAHVPVLEMVEARVEVQELAGATFTYRFEANQPSDYGVSLVANIIQSIDGYINREMIRRGKAKGFQVASVHDDFACSPLYGNELRQHYIDIMCELADSNLLADILSQISGIKVIIDKTTTDLSKYIRESDYPIC